MYVFVTTTIVLFVLLYFTVQRKEGLTDSCEKHVEEQNNQVGQYIPFCANTEKLDEKTICETMRNDGGCVQPYVYGICPLHQKYRDNKCVTEPSKPVK